MSNRSVVLPTAAADVSVAAALWAALRTFGRIPGARVVDQFDATLVFSETPYANFNNVIASTIAPDEADRRIPEILREFVPRSLPVTWWAGPTTSPTDLVLRLRRLGLARQEPEFAMAIDLAADWPPAPLPESAVLESVERPDQLDEWLGIMNAAYGWPDARKTAIVQSMYVADLSRPADERDIHHFLVRTAGRAVACSSLFVGGGEAFVTNIGTKPEARGRGLGSAVTVATLELARDLGRTTATLTASLDGRSVYRRLGFVEAGILERYVATQATMDDLNAAGRRASHS
jgi:ribosomal protein S18 acetylase RimI-like enzyme